VNRKNGATNRPARTRRALVFVYLSIASTGAVGGELSVTGTLASEYVYRGISLSDGNPAVQLGIDYQHASGLFAGAWASTVDLENFGGRRDVELDYYLGYFYTPDAPVHLSIMLLQHTYPGQSTFFNYNYAEALVTAELNERYSLEFGYSDDIYGWNRTGRHLEMRGDWPLPNAWVVSAGLGYNDLDNQGTSNHLYWDIGASARYSRYMLDVRWYDNETATGILAHLSAGSQWVVTITAGF
jgi:uncharacterized protein (TIGR02001 family)